MPPKTAVNRTAAKGNPAWKIFLLVAVFVSAAIWVISTSFPTFSAAAEKEPAANKMFSGKTAEVWSTEWNITSAEFHSAVAEAAKLGFTDDLLIVFLIAKKVPDGAAWPNDRVYQGVSASRYTFLANPPNTVWKERRKILSIIVGVESEAEPAEGNSAIPEEISFDAFCERFPEWADNLKSFVFFRDHPSLDHNDVLIQREQTFGTCGIHASMVLQHYLVAMANGRMAPTVDIAKWLRKHSVAEFLEGVVFGEGTNPEKVLRSILVRRSHILPAYDDIEDDIEDVMRRYGPLLLPMWAVTEEFRDSKKLSFSGKGSASEDNIIGHHAMLAVGFRRSKSTGKTYILLQNWWRQKQFVEVDEEYYESYMRHPALYVTTPQPEIPEPLRGDDTLDIFRKSVLDSAGVSGVGCGPVGTLCFDGVRL